ncbi:hypothetical protein LTR66_007601 [Elasticomyces elasticus]|nr:hypothetical protein LTR66_007601 [Elasticomyces elasticus]
MSYTLTLDPKISKMMEDLGRSTVLQAPPADTAFPTFLYNVVTNPWVLIVGGSALVCLLVRYYRNNGGWDKFVGDYIKVEDFWCRAETRPKQIIGIVQNLLESVSNGNGNRSWNELRDKLKDSESLVEELQDKIDDLESQLQESQQVAIARFPCALNAMKRRFR